MSDCLTPNEQFFSYYIQWDANNVLFILDKHAGSLKQQFTRTQYSDSELDH